MRSARPPAKGVIADQPAEVAVSPPELLARGYRPYERFSVKLAGSPTAQQRDILRAGLVIAVIPVDLERGEVVLIRQFRLAAHLGNGKGELIEMVAGRLKPDENPADAARRECAEEIGVTPSRVVELFSYFPTPGLTDEQIVVFLGAVDAAQVPARTGLPEEMEDIRPLRVSIDRAIAALTEGGLCSGLTITLLQWLALNRDRLDAIINTGATSPLG